MRCLTGSDNLYHVLGVVSFQPCFAKLIEAVHLPGFWATRVRYHGAGCPADQLAAPQQLWDVNCRWQGTSMTDLPAACYTTQCRAEGR